MNYLGAWTVGETTTPDTNLQQRGGQTKKTTKFGGRKLFGGAHRWAGGSTCLLYQDQGTVAQVCPGAGEWLPLGRASHHRQGNLARQKTDATSDYVASGKSDFYCSLQLDGGGAVQAVVLWAKHSLEFL